MRFARIACVIIGIAWALAGAGRELRAQADLTVWVNAPVAGGFVTSLPSDWPLWSPGAYPDEETAVLAARAVVLGTYPDLALGDAFMSGFEQLIGVPRRAPEEGVVRALVELMDAAAIATLPGDDSIASDPAALLSTLGLEVAGTARVSGRLTAFGAKTTFGQRIVMAAYYLPDRAQMAVLSLSAPDVWIAAQRPLVSVFLTSFRDAGEPYDVDAFRLLARANPPDAFVMPVTRAEVVITPFPGVPLPTPEATPAGTAEATAEATPEATAESCVVAPIEFANLRQGPALTFEVVRSMSRGQRAVASAQATDVEGFIWWRLADGAWVRTDVVMETGPCAALEVITP